MAIRLVLVDDHAVVREGLRALLTREKDIEVVGETGSTAELLNLVDKVRPEVVVMDLQLGNGQNGVEATRALLRKWPDLKIVILSMYDDRELIFRALEAGARGYVLKRAGVEELIQAIRLAVKGEAFLDPQIARRVIDGLQQGFSAAREDDAGKAELTDREMEVLRLAAEGMTNAEIARRLFISVKTVQAHRANLMQKLGLHDRVDLVKYAIKKGILKLEDD
ncbi:DNA-binding response regulator [Moorella sp. E308F]|jgi:two-component system response regulator NreC|uniref:response regulator n=1 Tax=unclassified Neomoorella TaxID=2676739 RepID=UPI0010FFC35C|nr:MULTISPECIES: response regulator transcription factor [unclassified Moorella (in: firmicutes)]GEA14487.1 DNA-binding response regulator [Moorella sp. E308F]GEA18141.1 DNA-binding response regulator [Moorella sp. E306M]